MWIIILAAYVTVALVLFGGLLGQFEDIEDAKTLSGFLAVIVFWPIAVVMAAIVILWRIPFKAARTIKTDIRNRKLSREFEEYLKGRIAKKNSVFDQN